MVKVGPGALSTLASGDLRPSSPAAVHAGPAAATQIKSTDTMKEQTDIFMERNLRTECYKMMNRPFMMRQWPQEIVAHRTPEVTRYS
jgi:hypothetical protein